LEVKSIQALRSIPDGGSLNPLVAFASKETLQYAMDVDWWTALEAGLFLVYLPTLSIIQSNDRMTHDELEKDEEGAVMFCQGNTMVFSYRDCVYPRKRLSGQPASRLREVSQIFLEAMLN